MVFLFISLLIGFLEKNRDTVWEEQIDLLKRSSIIGPLFMEESGIDSAPQKPGQKLKITAVCFAKLFLNKLNQD